MTSPKPPQSFVLLCQDSQSQSGCYLKLLCQSAASLEDLFGWFDRSTCVKHVKPALRVTLDRSDVTLDSMWLRQKHHLNITVAVKRTPTPVLTIFTCDG